MIKFFVNRNIGADTADLSQYGEKSAKEARDFHKTLAEYFETPLRSLDVLAENFGVGGIYVKDESYRFGLNAFKALGGSYAIGKLIEKEKNIGTVITATDGNHGRGVAWSAKKFGLKSVVYMPKGTARERLDNILKLGADASILDMNYDDAVKKAKTDADKNGWTLVQDTAFEGYEEIPQYIMQGYTTMALEADEQMGNIPPTHIFLQAGVGSMAAAVTAYFSDKYKYTKPVITIVEPNKADCFYLTASANDGEIHPYKGEMNTMMAGLACGEPCTLAWKILKEKAEYFVSIDDSKAALGMNMLADNGIVSGESGAPAFGFFCSLMTDEAMRGLRAEIKIDKNSRILFFSTEGATDRENFEKITGRKAEDIR